MDNTQQRLASAYHEILKGLPQHWLDRSRSHEAQYAKLSGLFLPGTSPDYQCAPQKILVVGRETRRWDVLKGEETFESLETYICKAMATQQDHLARFITRPRDRGESFFNLLRDQADQHGSAAIAWANLFCFAWNKKSPVRWEHFKKLLEISEQLLKAQVKILQPDIIIFANGASSAKFRQGYFPHKGESSVCSELGDFCDQGIALNQLWRFKLQQRIQCYRIQHPSSISAASRAARRFLLEQLRISTEGR
ncbi:putative uncharacterized protein [Pseudomonas sp. StFLB209]|uniref:hypothetical protein n=1 Tax=Pseudomonas sp. StFLB209 TaxID=1028989 RepID=UPI0004F74C1B|nr:hypothetical protein [Pseudomonas sp. StFLB209]BAP45787.1 putative uncharacterized protein [Pseudomonas sp. StFLB209]